MSPAQPRRTIGGDFELDQLRFGSLVQLNRLTRGLEGCWTTSGRGALSLVLTKLRAEGVRQLHLPAYLCESVLLPARALGFDFSFYPVDLSLGAQPDPPEGAATLVIHYFGWLNSAVSNLRQQAGAGFPLIEDAVQALLSDWTAPQDVDRYLILSPRKFGPAILGGWCNVPRGQFEETACEVGPVAWRALAARLARGAYLRDKSAPVDAVVEDFYLAGLRAVETFLDQHPTCLMLPSFALDQLAGIDWQETALRRRANWQQLHGMLSGRVDTIEQELPEQVVPLGYVVRLRERERVRAALAAQRIFCPVHWPLPIEVARGRFPGAAALAETCLTLPLDQRYDESEMTRMAEALLAAL